MIQIKRGISIITLFIILLITLSIPSIAYTKTPVPAIDESKETMVEINIPFAIRAYNHAYQENYQADALDLLLSESVNAYILLEPDALSKDDLLQLKNNGNQLSAYISIGTGENWREDYKNLKPYLTNKEWDEWSGERFVRKITPQLIQIMKKRIDKVAASGYDWIEFDNMDFAFDEIAKEKYAIAVSRADAIAYYQELCAYAQEKDLKVMAKNTLDSIDSFDGVTFESYENDYNWWDETRLKDFIALNKNCFIVHYNALDPSNSYFYYKERYGDAIWFIVESKLLEHYVHFN